MQANFILRKTGSLIDVTCDAASSVIEGERRVEHYAAVTVVAEESWAADEFAPLLRSLCNLSILCQPKNPREQNQKNDTSTRPNNEQHTGHNCILQNLASW